MESPSVLLKHVDKRLESDRRTFSPIGEASFISVQVLP